MSSLLARLPRALAHRAAFKSLSTVPISFSIKRPTDGDDKDRSICNTCGFVDYKNPKLVVGAVVSDSEGRVLLARRAIEPRRGTWNLPAGYMEMYESLDECARRECWEETGAKIETKGLLRILSVPEPSQVHVYFSGVFAPDTGPTFAPSTTESLEVKLFAEADIPWKELSFPTTKDVLQTHFSKAPVTDLTAHTVMRRPVKA